MAIYHEEVIKIEREGADGNVTVDTAVVTQAIRKNEEPDYVKLYIDGWRGANGIPARYRQLFLSLAMRMDYANIERGGDPDEGGQIVCVMGRCREALLRECGWNGDDALCKGLKALVDCGALRKISRGFYQINPRYAARGTWHYSSRKNQGGVENLLAAFVSDNQKAPTKESRVQAAARSGEVEEEIELIASTIKVMNEGEDAPF